MNIKIFGITLYILSILVGITLSAKVVPKGQWPTNMPLFIITIIGAIVGLIFWHKSNRAMVKEMLNEVKDGAGPIYYLNQVKSEVSNLSISDNYLANVDAISEGSIFNFIEESKKLLDIYGQEKGAEIILSFAQMERYLNRSWSAYSDGHMQETKDSLDKAQLLCANLQAPA
jgi:hypothetical protein